MAEANNITMHDRLYIIIILLGTKYWMVKVNKFLVSLGSIFIGMIAIKGKGRVSAQYHTPSLAWLQTFRQLRPCGGALGGAR